MKPGALELYDVTTWPSKWRKLFVLFFPITVPIWLTFVVASMIIAMFAIVALAIIVCVIEIWEGNDFHRSERKAKTDE